MHCSGIALTFARTKSYCPYSLAQSPTALTSVHQTLLPSLSCTRSCCPYCLVPKPFCPPPSALIPVAPNPNLHLTCNTMQCGTRLATLAPAFATTLASTFCYKVMPYSNSVVSASVSGSHRAKQPAACSLHHALHIIREPHCSCRFCTACNMCG